MYSLTEIVTHNLPHAFGMNFLLSALGEQQDLSKQIRSSMQEGGELYHVNLSVVVIVGLR